MHRPSQKTAEISLTILGGLCTETAPSDLPEGASPLNHDMDYLVGSAKTRDGLQSAFTLWFGDFLLLETGDYILQETGFRIRLEV